MEKSLEDLLAEYSHTFCVLVAHTHIKVIHMVYIHSSLSKSMSSKIIPLQFSPLYPLIQTQSPGFLQ